MTEWWEKGIKEGKRKKKAANRGKNQKITRDTEVRVAKKKKKEKESREKTAFLSQPGGERQLCLSDL